MTLDAVVENAVMLLALCWLLAFTTRSWNRSGQRTAKLLAGLWFGSACIFGMLNTSIGQTGIILDARTAVLSMAGLFGGPLVAGIAGVLAGGFRLWMGGPGVVPGLANVLLPIALGLAYRCASRRRLIGIAFWQLLGFGVLLHLG
ncbi:MAG TPA: histidine kinase, partial [Pseudomonas sp.]|nr:histidine kinase [Pseudomonas sp.]